MLTTVLQDAFAGESVQRAYELCHVLQLRVNQQASQHFNVIRGKLIKIFGKHKHKQSRNHWCRKGLVFSLGERVGRPFDVP